MIIQIKARNFKLTPKIKDLIWKKFGRLYRFGILPEEVLEVGLLDDFGPQKGRDKVITINLARFGKKHVLRIEERDSSWDEAIDFAKERLEEVLEKEKDKDKAAYKRKKVKFSRRLRGKSR